MKEPIFSRKFWQKVFNYQLIIWFLLMISYTFSQRNNHFYFIGDLFNLAFSTAIMGLNFYVQFKKDSSKTNTQIVRWLTIVIFPFNFCQIWHITGNFLLKNLPAIEILLVLLLWAVYIFLLVPIAVVHVGPIKNWFLRLLTIYFLDIQYGDAQNLAINPDFRWLHSLTYQGVIAAIALLTMTCFLVKAWGYHFNPNLKFIKIPSFQKKILLALLIMATIDLFYNEFINYDKAIWTVFFGVDIGSFKFSIPNLTAAIEPGILEETERYLLIVIFLAGFNRFPKYRIPVAIYGSAILFGLSHLSNFGWHGESFTATIAQVIGVMGSAFIWAELYLYTGKLWLPMIYHFLMDYISDLQSGWNSAGWSWNGEITDYIYTVLIVDVPLLFSIWMLFGKRRQVMEDNADLILNLNGRQSMI